MYIHVFLHIENGNKFQDYDRLKDHVRVGKYILILPALS